jgi:RNA polymerase primary sigma factor
VVKIARDFVGRGIPLDDLIGEGNLGLIRAVEDFDPSFGTRFSTYAGYWIKEAIRHALINTTATIRLPAHMVGLLTKWRRAERMLGREAGCAPTFEEVASSLRLSATQKALVAQALLARQVKLASGMVADSGRGSDDDAIDRHEVPESLLEADDERAMLFRRMKRLDARERAILELRYGLGGGRPLTFKEIGRRLGVTREWVRRIELRALSKLDDAHAAGSSQASPRKQRAFRAASSLN